MKFYNKNPDKKRFKAYFNTIFICKSGSLPKSIINKSTLKIPSQHMLPNSK